MKLMVTGAGGFLGRYVVASAVQRGHEVRAMVRPASQYIPESWHGHPKVEIVRGDLRASHGTAELLEGVDGVIQGTVESVVVRIPGQIAPLRREYERRLRVGRIIGEHLAGTAT